MFDDLWHKPSCLSYLLYSAYGFWAYMGRDIFYCLDAHKTTHTGQTLVQLVVTVVGNTKDQMKMMKQFIIYVLLPQYWVWLFQGCILFRFLGTAAAQLLLLFQRTFFLFSYVYLILRIYFSIIHIRFCPTCHNKEIYLEATKKRISLQMKKKNRQRICLFKSFNKCVKINH